ncbi:MAG: SRPBCC family protein [Bacteroidota bacterium]
MEFIKTTTVDKPIEKVWEILGNQFGEAYKWAGGLYHSEGFGTPALEYAPFNSRACNTSQGKITEEIRVFDPENYKLVYEVVKGFPGFVEVGKNQWSLSPVGDKTEVHMHLVIETKGIMGFIMGPMMGMQLKKVVSTVLEDFKHFVETGSPSPSKAKEMAKQGQLVA